MFVRHAVIVMDMDMVCPVDIPEEIVHLPHGIRVAEVKGHADTVDALGHADQFLRLPAEKFLDTDHIFKAGKDRMFHRGLPDLPEGFFLEFLDLLRDKFANW